MRGAVAVVALAVEAVAASTPRLHVAELGEEIGALLDQRVVPAEVDGDLVEVVTSKSLSSTWR